MKKINFMVMAMLLMGLAFFVNMDTASAASSIYVNVTSGSDTYDGQSAIYNGTSGPKKTINGGVTVVDANGIVNIANGVYTGTGNVGITISKNMTLKGQTKTGTIINGSDTSRIFTISNGFNVTLLNLTIADGKASKSNGGAVRNNGGTLTINNCTFKSNSATLNNQGYYGFGGAIYNTGTLSVVGSTFTSNTAEADGGAIYNIGTATIVGSTFTNNSLTGTYGGAIYNGGTLTVIASNFTNNTGYDGGAISHGTVDLLPTGILTIIDSNFTGNVATSAGGAIWTHGSSSIANSIFSNNTADTSGSYTAKGDGGAIRNWGNMNLTESIFINNTATVSGDAISNYQGTLNATFNEFITNGDNDINVENNGATSVVIANNNWWGSNSAPAPSRFTADSGATATISSWLTLSVSAPSYVFTGSNTVVLVYLTYNSNGTNTSVTGAVPDGTMITLTCTLGSITSSASTINGTATVIFTAGIIPGQAVINATVSGYTNSTNITIVSLANIELNQTVNTPVNIGEKLTILVTATNKGPNTATNINIRDIIPVGLTGVTFNPSAGTTYNSATGIWYIPSLTNGSSAILNITGTVSAAMAGKITNNTVSGVNQTQNTTQLPSSTVSIYTNLMNSVFVSPTGNDVTGNGSASNPFKTIATGISVVSSGGIIHLLDGTYNEHDLVINNNVTIVGASASSTIIDAQKLGRIFNITSGSTVTITNLTLQNGNATGNGGAINNAGNLTIIGTNLLNNIATGTGRTIYNTGNIVMHFNKILGNGTVIASPSGSVDATLNWWVINTNPSAKVSGNVDVSTWLVLTISASPNVIKTCCISLITADLQHDNNGVYYSPNVGHVPDGIVITFSSTLGTVSPITNVIVNGSTTTNFTATTHSGVAIINASGSPMVSTDVDILADDIYVSPSGSDLTGNGTAGSPYATIAKAVQMTAPGGNVHIMPGTFTGDGNFNVNIDKNINIIGSGASTTVIDAASLGRIFNITDGTTVSITNLTMVNGLVDGDGGAIINAGNLTVTGCNMLNNIATGTGGAIYNTGNVSIHFNRIIGDGIVIVSPSGSVDAVNNWWGSNAGSITKVSGAVDVSRWLVSDISSSNNSLQVGGTSVIMVDLTHNNLGEDTIGQGHVPDGIIVDFTNTLGSVNPLTIALTNGAGTSNFDAGYTPGIAIITSWIDGYSVSEDIKIYSLVNITVDTYAYSKYIDWNYNVAVPFILSVKNNGAADVNGVIVRTQLPVGVEFLSANLRSGTSFNYDSNTRILTWFIDRLPGNVLSVFEYTVINKMTGMVNITSTAQVGTFSQSVNWTVNTPNYTDVEITQNASSYNPVIGEVVDLVIKAYNHGPSSTTINIASVLSGLSLISATPNKGSFSNSTGLWTVGTLANGEIATLTLKVNVDSYSAISSAYRKSSSVFDTNTTNNGQTIYLRVEDPIIIVG